MTTARKYVVDIYGLLTTQLGEGLLMEYCPGGSIAELVTQRSAFELGECVTALAPIAQTIAGLHLEGLRHGDISPSNILLTAQGMPKIIDFQESSLGQDVPATAGTPGFVDPLALQGGEEEVFGSQDVYALGSCLWYLLDGEPPDEAHFRPPVRVQFPLVPQIIQELLAQSLDQDPRLRPTADQFARTLFSSTPAQPIRWEGFIDPDGNQLMDTIHPELERRSARRGRERLAADSRKRCRQSKIDSDWHGHLLRRTPGGAKIVITLAAGALVMAASFFGVKYLLPGPNADPAAQAAPPVNEAGCRILDVGEVPACAFEADTVIASFLELSAQRDRAMNESDARALAKIYVEGSDQLLRDRQTLATMSELNLRFKGLATSMENISVQARGAANTVVLNAYSTQSAYSYVDSAGAIRHQVAAGEGEWIRVEVELVDGQWRLGLVHSRTQ
ncbi:protein kinase [Glutamicibacter sp. NPDC087344]|uniref:protein kinase domain-containing protein n=1 Tax=Glutamicibacter sp. NPDC087344 TaxID=3363994 RepID=UPI00381D6C19